MNSGWFNWRLRSNWPITIETAGLKCYQRKCFTHHPIGYYFFENTSFDSLPKRLEFGQTYIYSIPMTEAINRRQNFERTDNVHLSDLKVFICVSTAKSEIIFKLDKDLKSKILDR